MQKYPDSKYASLVRPTEDKAGKVDTGVSVVNFYDETYALLVQYQYTDVLRRVHEAQKKYKDPKFEKRFHIMEAIALAGSGNLKQADTLLKEFVKANPSDSLKIWADNIFKFLAKNPPMPLAADTTGPLLSHWPYYGQPLGKPVSAAELARADSIANGTLVAKKDTAFATTAAEDKPVKAANNLPALIEYSVNPSAEHYIGIVLPGIENRLVKLRATLKEIESKDQPHTIFIDIFNQEHSILLVKSFPDLATAKNYLAGLADNLSIFSEYKPNEYQLFIISAKDYKKLLFDHNISDYLDFYNQNFK
jgi:hypothetical protein